MRRRPRSWSPSRLLSRCCVRSRCRLGCSGAGVWIEKVGRITREHGGSSSGSSGPHDERSKAALVSAGALLVAVFPSGSVGDDLGTLDGESVPTMRFEPTIFRSVLDGYVAARWLLVTNPHVHGHRSPQRWYSDGRVLMVHRHPDRRWYPDCWDLIGGHIEPGESPMGGDPGVRGRSQHPRSSTDAVPMPMPMPMTDYRDRGTRFRGRPLGRRADVPRPGSTTDLVVRPAPNSSD